MQNQECNKQKIPKSFSEWDYTDENGPQNWPKKYPNGLGAHQSPIDIVTSSATYDPQLTVHPLSVFYEDACFTEVKNTGHSFNVSGLSNANSRVSGGPLKDNYKFLQFHMHWAADDHSGSEHTIDGHSYAAEIHFVNWNVDKYSEASDAVKSMNHEGLAVLGALIKAGKHNEEFDKLIECLKMVPLKNQKTNLKHTLNFKKLLPSNMNDYYHYLGSLTTPPLTEAVKWIVFKDLIEISSEQLRALRQLHQCDDEYECSEETKILVNYRPVCPLNDRKLSKSFH